MKKHTQAESLKKYISEFPNGSQSHDLLELWLDDLTTELWRIHGKQGCIYVVVKN